MLTRISKIFLLVATIGLLLFLSWFSLEYYRPEHTAPKRIIFEVEKGQTVKDIAENLKQNGIIRKTWPLLLGYKMFYSPQSLKAGEYAISLPVSAKDVLGILTDGSVLLHAVTIPEGLIIEEIADILESQKFTQKKKFIAAAHDTTLIAAIDDEADNLEGYLFPETYHFAKGTTAEEIVFAMVTQFRHTFSPDWQRHAAKMGMSIRDTVIFASLIEKETSLLEEKRLVSAVFHNRLKRGMKLDCDPTIIYELKKKGKFNRRLRTKDLKLNSPYNTYLYPGLPPGPISNPGKTSLEAALNPAEKDYLYFVSKNNGSHHFSRTIREHINAVNKYQRRQPHP
jgi:UPF0755 protein